MRGLPPNFHHSSYIFFSVFFVLILFPEFSFSANTLSHTESLTLSSNNTISSLGNIFELGFFKPASASRWYLGVWYKVISKRTYVWVANRDHPLSSSIGTLKISDSNLVLLDQSDTPVWSTNLTRGDVTSPVVAELLDNGNFVLRDSENNSPDGVLWQSFDFPTDTLLPEMKLGWDLKTGYNRFLRSWKSLDDPSSGDFSFRLETRGFPESFLWNKESRVYRSGPWNGIRFSGVPEMQPFDYMVFNFTASNDVVTYSFHITKNNIYSRLSLSSTGSLQRFTWIESAQNWNQFWYAPKDQCDEYKECGTYGYCDSNTSPVCNCIRGFEPRNPQVWGLRDGSDGCVRKTELSCEGGDGFVRLKKMKLPDTTASSVDRGIGTRQCEEKCKKDCNCTAFANTDIRDGGFGCVTWTGEISDIRNYAKGGQDLYVRLAATDLDDERNRSAKIIGSIIGVGVLLLLLSFIIFCWKRKQKRSMAIETPFVDQVRSQDLLMNEVVISSRRHISRENKTEDLELPLMEFDAVSIATDKFSNANKLGQGGFGIVYKGRLLDGQEIAVKRLSKMSVQGTGEFKNEVRLIARLQHINLVRLLGCCVDKGEKMLIYEYLENLSLDFHLFDKTRRSNLNWQTRFDIINGIARGLLYLHQDSRFRIIHRDLKASNVLLGKDMTPKISDFGMARIFGREEGEAITRKVVGTYGYMSPEYAMDGIFSMKSDVFSFGVLLLEIISGKRNRGFYDSNRDLNLLGCVWRYWKEGNGFEIVDPIITESPSTFRPHEIFRCIQIGLLCVQERADDRPMMSSVVLMFGSETTAIPQPKPPGYCVGRSPLETDSSSSKQHDDEYWTVNQMTVSVLDARNFYWDMLSADAIQEQLADLDLRIMGYIGLVGEEVVVMETKGVTTATSSDSKYLVKKRSEANGKQSTSPKTENSAAMASCDSPTAGPQFTT
uniref:non-specific serine/threonine protein kinase n=1 Tax=Sisymbrium irio TaxID=3730 RepID=R9S9Z3_SISIR|nr:putative receptor kinase 3 [Sisymbrium irio]